MLKFGTSRSLANESFQHFVETLSDWAAEGEKSVTSWTYNQVLSLLGLHETILSPVSVKVLVYLNTHYRVMMHRRAFPNVCPSSVKRNVREVSPESSSPVNWQYHKLCQSIYWSTQIDTTINVSLTYSAPLNIYKTHNNKHEQELGSTLGLGLLRSPARVTSIDLLIK